MIGTTKNNRNRPLAQAHENGVGPAESVRMGDNRPDVVKRYPPMLIRAILNDEKSAFHGNKKTVRFNIYDAFHDFYSRLRRRSSERL